MDNEHYQELLNNARNFNKLGIQERKNGNYKDAVNYFSKAIETYPAEPFFFNRGLAYLACINNFSQVSVAADDMFVALIMGYLAHKNYVSQDEMLQSIMYYLTKMMQINLLNEDIILKNTDEKNLYLYYILSDKFAPYTNYVQNPKSDYERQIIEWFKSDNFNNAFNNYLNTYAIGPFNMELSNNDREQWLSQSRHDVSVYLNSPEMIQGTYEIYNLLFKD